MASMMASNQFKNNSIEKGKNTEKLSSGYRINRAADDAAGLQISEKMRAQIRGLEQGARNIQEGISYCQVADGALNEIQDMLHRLTELCVKGANETNSDVDRAAINQEIEEIKKEMNRICETTKYNEDYIFKSRNEEDELPPYDVFFDGVLKDIHIYNDSYDADTESATYGGIAFKGKRYAWNSIHPNMYDSATKTFKEGRYTLRAEDGSYVTILCKDGTEPPQIERELKTSADNKGIYFNKTLVPWEAVTTKSGEVFDPKNILNETYVFHYGGVQGSFTPDVGDLFSDVKERISDITFKTTYNIPTEETAVMANFSKMQSLILSNDVAKGFLNGSKKIEYQLTADSSGLKLIDLSTGGVLANSTKTWTDLGITNWGDQSKDIWNDKIYTYLCEQTASSKIEFSFVLINETSMDSVIGALDGVIISSQNGSYEVNNYIEVAETSDRIIDMKLSYDFTDITLEEEFELGREFSKLVDTYATQSIEYNAQTGNFSVSYFGMKDAMGDSNITNKIYSNTDYETATIVNNIRQQILKSTDGYMELILARYQAGASNPIDFNLASILGSDKITGNGTNTYLEDVVSLNAQDANLKCTENFTGIKEFAGASIDFSGLGTDYKLADLIGTGFDSTCQTCSNHYSVQFTTSAVKDAQWQNIQIDGKNYQYAYQQIGNDHSLYINLESMMEHQISSGTEFTNVLVDVFDKAKSGIREFDYHFTQYATDITSAQLYIFDNRVEYAQSGISSAYKADFAPHAYKTDSTVEFAINLYDEDIASVGESVGIDFKYDYGDLFSKDKLKITASEETDGLYVFDSIANAYVLYDSSKHTNGEKRYNITNIQFDTNGASKEAFLNSYIRDSIFAEITNKTTMSLVGEDAKISLLGNLNQNHALVTTFSTPIQIKPKNYRVPENNAIKIQCSANDIDQIMIKKQSLSVNKMGLKRLNVSNAERATRSIALVDKATDMVCKIRSTFGAYQNRLEHAYAINRNTEENTLAAESLIRDADMAEEMVNYSAKNILLQVSQSMIAHANQSVQGVIQILQ